MATTIGEMEEGWEPVTVESTGPLPWPTWEAFLAWLTEGNDWRVFTPGVHGVFLYENSD
jgi:hypothetical protein